MATMTPDAAFTAFKDAEGKFTSANGAQTGAASALAAAQQAKDSADSDLNAASVVVKGAADDLIAALQAFETSLSSPVPPAIPAQ